MAWRMDQSVVEGFIDNTVRNRITGKIWLLGRDDPVELDLEGNAHRDLAGCRLTFKNPQPVEGDDTDLHPLQAGTAGDFTASRKVRVLDVSVEEASALAKAGKPIPEHKGNCVYLEWFSDFNGRVVIESVDFDISVGERAWEMSPEEETAQHDHNKEAMRDWVSHLSEEDFDDDGEDGGPDFESEEPMDEFAWEKFLKESDALTDRYMEALDKYQDHPDCERLVAREMGWTWLEEALEAEEKGAFEEAGKEDQGDTTEDVEPLEPNPLTEGVDWVRDDQGRIHHPLTSKAMRVAISMWHQCDELGLIGEEGDDEVRDMVFQAQTLSAKLAGALDHLAYETEREPGFVVACLKRSLRYLHESIAVSERVAGRDILPEELLNNFRQQLFDVRERVLELMERFRETQW